MIPTGCRSLSVLALWNASLQKLKQEHVVLIIGLHVNGSRRMIGRQTAEICLSKSWRLTECQVPQTWCNTPWVSPLCVRRWRQLSPIWPTYICAAPEEAILYQSAQRYGISLFCLYLAGHPLSTVPEDYSCSGTSIDRIDNRCHGNGVSFQGNGGLGRGRLGPSTLSKVRRTAAVTRQCPRLAIENEHSPAANDCPSLSRSPRRAEPLPPKLRIISDEYDDYEDENTGDSDVAMKATGSYALVHDGDQVSSAYYHPLGVRLTTVWNNV